MSGFKLHFLGMCVRRFAEVYDFYTEHLGIQPEIPPDAEGGNWAMMSDAWAKPTKSRGVRWEMFEAEPGIPSVQAWGIGQNLRPSIQVKDLTSTVNHLQQRGVSFTSTIEENEWGQWIEFSDPEGIRWSLSHLVNYPSGDTLTHPHIGWFQLKTEHMAEQQQFYSEVLGLRCTDQTEHGCLFEQESGEPILSLHRGGTQQTLPQQWQDSIAFHVPTFMSFEVIDIAEAYQQLLSHQVKILQETTYHPDWEGTDMLVADRDHNVVQIVQYGKS